MAHQPPDEEALFHAARRITEPAARALFIEQACGDNAALAERVRVLLAMDEQEPEVPEAPGGSTATYEPIAERPGSRIGPYVLREQIGEGGFGLVFVAEQQEPVRRKVALKIIKPGMDSKQVIARFEAERQALALMDHPNIAKVLDAGATDSGRPYFVMELVRGIPITDYCDKNQLAPKERLELFITVCHAIQHAHQKGIIHRDVKPSNVLVTSHDGKPVAKVIDFGVAKAIHQHLTANTIYTNFAEMIGTPLYMSPEQAEMSGLDIDTRSDIYSLGVLLYELLTGTTPLEKKRFATAAYDEIRRLIREEEPPKPSTRLSSSDSLSSIAAQRHTEPGKLSRLVRGDLDWITMKALEKDRTRRYETANGLGRDIQRYLSDEPVEACPPSTGYRLRKFAWRNKGALLAAAVVSAALLAGTAVSTWQAVRATRNGAEAERQRQRAAGNFRQALAAVDRMLTRVGEKRLAMVPQMEEERQRLLEDALEFYGQLLHQQSEEPEVRQETGRAYQRTAQIYQVLGKHEAAERAYGQALALQRGLVEQFPQRPIYRQDEAASQMGLGGLLRQTGQSGRAERAYQAALDVLQPLAKTQPQAAEYRLSLAAAHAGLGRLYQDAGRQEAAAAALQRALALCEELVQAHSEEADFQGELAKVHQSLGQLSRDQGDKPKAQQSLEVARSLWRRLAQVHPQLPDYENELARSNESCGTLYREDGQVGPAETALHEALALRQKLVHDHPKILEYEHDLASTYVELGALHRMSRQQDLARAELHKAMQIQERLHRDYPHELAFAVKLGMSYGEMANGFAYGDQPEEAMTWYARNIAILQEVLDIEPKHLEARFLLSNTRTHRADALVRLGRRPEAEKDWRQMAELGAGQDHADLRTNRALGLAHLGDHQGATAEVYALQASGRESSYGRYNFVCVFALAARAAQNDPTLLPDRRNQLAVKYGAEAVQVLARMKSAGFFRTAPGLLEYLKADSDLEPLRPRADYQALLHELEKEGAATGK
jgi:serine/threonine protein kinase/tetratricopeptide (TPR) repeat protein